MGRDSNQEYLRWSRTSMHRKFQCFILNILSIVGCTLSLANYSYSADITLVNNTVFGTVINIEGEIVKGDANAFYDIYLQAKELDRLFSVQLNSTGGDFYEGMEIAEAIINSEPNSYTEGLATFVDKKSVCTSVCAFIFLSGRVKQQYSLGETSRFLEPGARIGFHSPFHDRGAGNFADGVAAVRRLKEVLGNLLPDELLINTLLMGPKETYYLDFVAELIRWDISLVNINVFDLKKREALMNACENYHAFDVEEENFRISVVGFEKSFLDGYGELYSAERNNEYFEDYNIESRFGKLNIESFSGRSWPSIYSEVSTEMKDIREGWFDAFKYVDAEIHGNIATIFLTPFSWVDEMLTNYCGATLFDDRVAIIPYISFHPSRNNAVDLSQMDKVQFRNLTYLFIPEELIKDIKLDEPN